MRILVCFVFLVSLSDGLFSAPLYVDPIDVGPTVWVSTDKFHRLILLNGSFNRLSSNEKESLSVLFYGQHGNLDNSYQFIKQSTLIYQQNYFYMPLGQVEVHKPDDADGSLNVHKQEAGNVLFEELGSLSIKQVKGKLKINCALDIKCYLDKTLWMFPEGGKSDR